MDHSIITDNQIVGCVRNVAHFIEVLLDNLEFVFWNASLLGLFNIVIVFGFTDVCSDETIELIQFNQLLHYVSSEATSSRPKLNRFELAIGWHVFCDKLEHFLIAYFEGLNRVGRLTVFVLEARRVNSFTLLGAETAARVVRTTINNITIIDAKLFVVNALWVLLCLLVVHISFESIKMCFDKFIKIKI